MKIFIITEGGKNIGFGHITRCVSLCQGFEERDIIPQFIVNGDEHIEDLLRGKNYQIFNWLKEKNKSFELIKDADVAIIDSYLADISFYETLSELVKIPVYMDDIERLDYPQGIVVNGNIYAQKLNYPEREDLIHLCGTKYLPLRKAFWEIPKKEIKEKIESIVVTFGGNDTQNMTPKVLKLLIENYPQITKNVVIGKGFSNRDETERLRLKDKKTILIYYPDAEEMKNIMLDSDVAISAGGQTLYELARIGIPTIAIVVTNNQLNNANGWQKVGFVELAGWYNENDLVERLKDLMKNLEDVNRRKDKSKKGRKLVDGKGVFRVIDEIGDALALSKKGSK